MEIVRRLREDSELRERIISIALRFSVALAFVYPPIAAFINPEAWVGFFPLWFRDLLPNDTLFLHLFGASELVLAGWILFGKRVAIPSLIAAAYLTVIVALNWRYADTLFRDLSILGAAIALALRSR